VGLSEIAQAESLRDTAERVMLSWHELIEPALQRYSTVMVIGHGNCLRALLKHLDHISDDAISDVEVNNGVPIVYELDAARQPVSKCVLESAPYQRSEIL
jgi:2,3-bisphosphoglycerate-dependent phosphoglycerate mutase